MCQHRVARGVRLAPRQAAAEISRPATDGRDRPAPPEPFQRGINSFQLWHDGDRWWILSIFWHGEHEGAPIPGRYGG